MRDRWRTPIYLSWVLAAVMAAQSALGLVFSGEYRDVAWITATWFGNDLVSLAIAVPLLATSLILASRGSARGELLWLGMLGYAIYNYAYYMLGASLNRFFVLYVLAFVLGVSTLILALTRLHVANVAARFSSRTPVRILGGYLAFVAFGLTSIWMGMWFAYAFLGIATPVEPDAFRLVAALDVSLMVPVMLVGGVLLWRRASWGYVVATLASVQGALYLLVLTVNSAISISRGLTEAPGELPIWGTLGVLTAAAALTLLSCAGSRKTA